MLLPKRTKYRKTHKGRIRGNATRGHEVDFGSFAIKSLEPGLLTSRQIEAARQAIVRAMKREGKIWIRVFPDKPITKKPAEVRMGKGKGSPEFWAAPIHPGKVLFEAEGVPLAVAVHAMSLGAQKLPLKTKFVTRKDYQE